METNKIYLGSCYDLIKQIPDKSVDLVYIDIPYLYDSGGGGHSPLGQRIHKVQKQEIKEIVNGIDYSIFDELCRVMKKTYIYIWCSKMQLLDIMKYFVEKKNCLYDLLVWCKTNPTPQTNNVFLPDVEYCFCFREKGCKLNDGYELKSKYYISSINKDDKDKFLHPTIKPLPLVQRHILHSTQPNDVVLDCFMGSGTTCVACKNTGRQYIGMEINPEYYSIAEKRLNNEDANGQMKLFTD